MNLIYLYFDNFLPLLLDSTVYCILKTQNFIFLRNKRVCWQITLCTHFTYVLPDITLSAFFSVYRTIFTKIIHSILFFFQKFFYQRYCWDIFQNRCILFCFSNCDRRFFFSRSPYKAIGYNNKTHVDVCDN